MYVCEKMSHSVFVILNGFYRRCQNIIHIIFPFNGTDRYSVLNNLTAVSNRFYFNLQFKVENGRILHSDTFLYKHCLYLMVEIIERSALPNLIFFTCFSLL